MIFHIEILHCLSEVLNYFPLEFHLTDLRRETVFTFEVLDKLTGVGSIVLHVDTLPADTEA